MCSLLSSHAWTRLLNWLFTDDFKGLFVELCHCALAASLTEASCVKYNV